MGSAATCLTVPVESAPERQTKSLAPRPRRWSSAAWQEEKLAKPLSPLLYLQHPDDAPRDAGDDERWRKLDEELTAAKARALANTSARPAWLAEQPAEVQQFAARLLLARCPQRVEHEAVHFGRHRRKCLGLGVCA